MDAGRVKKLEEYINYLGKQADAKEAKGDSSEAVKDYLKLVDALLVLASGAPDHPTWLKYTKQAEVFQQKIKNITSSPGYKKLQESEGVHAQTRQPPQQPQVETQRTESSQAQDVSAKQKPRKKFLGVFRKNEEPSKDETEEIRQESQQAQPQQYEETEAPQAEEGVPYSVYADVLAKYEQLQNRVANMVERTEYVSAQTRLRELSEKISGMVPKLEVERLQTQLNNSVPRSMYEQLEREMASMVPKEMYLSAEIRASKLEAELSNSVPRKALDELVSKIAILSGLVDDSPPPKSQQPLEEPVISESGQEGNYA